MTDHERGRGLSPRSPLQPVGLGPRHHDPCTQATAGPLSGRIIQENGASLAKAKVVVEGKEFVTNEFGGYEVELKDGARQLNMVIDNTPYTSETIPIPPRIRQEVETPPSQIKALTANWCPVPIFGTDFVRSATRFFGATQAEKCIVTTITIAR